MSKGYTPATSAEVWRVCDRCKTETSRLRVGPTAPLANELPVGWSSVSRVMEGALTDNEETDYCATCTTRMLM